MLKFFTEHRTRIRKEILEYLPSHPSSYHHDICQALDEFGNAIDEYMRELETEGKITRSVHPVNKLNLYSIFYFLKGEL